MNIDTVLEEWNNSKEKKSYYEKECEKYKEAVERYMNNKQISKITGKQYVVNRRNNTRTTLSKKDIPNDIWTKYSTRVNYNSYYISRKK